MPERIEGPVTIRPATTADAAAIRMVGTVTWTATYKDILAPESIAYFLNLSYAIPQIEQRIARANGVTLVAQAIAPPHAGRVVGYAFAGPYRDNHAEGEVYALYVLPAAQGHGVGHQLWRRALAALKALALGERVWVGVLAANQSARVFYERQGAALDRASPLEIGTQTVSEAWYRVEG